MIKNRSIRKGDEDRELNAGSASHNYIIEFDLPENQRVNLHKVKGISKLGYIMFNKDKSKTWVFNSNFNQDEFTNKLFTVLSKATNHKLDKDKNKIKVTVKK